MPIKICKNFVRQYLKKILNNENERFGFVYYGKMKNSSIDTSSTGERKNLESIVKTLNLDKGFCVDIGANDGFSNSCTLGLFSNSWRGLAIEINPKKFATLSYLYKSFENVTLLKLGIQPRNILKVFEACNVPQKFEVLNIDIDSYDLEVVSTILEHYRPKIITMEINEKIVPGIFFSVRFAEDHIFRGDHFFGASISAVCEVIKPKNYKLWKVVYNNAFFIDAEVCNDLIIDLPSLEAWRIGYKEAQDREKLFHFNSDVDYWMNLEPTYAIREINKIFKIYSGKYDIRLSSY